MICINPVFIRRAGISVRCGKCLPCRENRQKEWSTRLEQELKQAFTAYFVTLTYNDESLLKYPKLDKSCFQRFLKRLRQYDIRGMPIDYNGKKVLRIDGKGQNFKYFAVGEYGTKNLRPHWHFLIFNFPYDVEMTETIIDYAWREDSKSLGFDHIGIIKPGAIQYVTDYLFKNDHKECVRLISKGIGLSYINDNNLRYHQSKQDGMIVNHGIKKSMPRYYSQKLFNQEQRQEIGEKKSGFILEQNLADPYAVEKQFIELKQKVNFRNNLRK
jgi:hypothetical protein